MKGSFWSTAAMMVEGNLEVKLPTIWTDEEQRRKPEEKVREEKRREEKRKPQESHKKVTCRPSGARNIGKT